MNISFVIPSYNSASTLAESVDSIFNGNFIEGDEVIIVNDCSMDNTPEVLAALIQKYPQIIVINNEQNKGCPASRNVGIARASNELIFNLDADNILAKGSVAPLKEFLIRESADMASFSQYFYFISDTSKLTHKWICHPGLFTLSDLLAGSINPGPGGNYLYTKKSWEKIGGYWEYGKGLHEAWGFTLKQLANGARFMIMPDSFYYHRHGHASLFVRENRNYASSEMASRMIEPFLSLLEPADAAYITSEPDKNTWFDRIDKRPLRLKGQPVGKNGKIKYTSPIRALIYQIRKLIP